MALIRLAVRRASALRVAPTMVRNYPGRQEGATASSQGFRDREQAQENQYMREREKELLAAAREKLKKAQEEVAHHEQRIKEAEEKK